MPQWHIFFVVVNKQPLRRNLIFWWLVFILLITLGVYFGLRLADAGTRLSSNQPGLYKIVNFDDGDTVTVDMNGTVETVRFIGVDTPETHHPDRPIECYGTEASVYTKKLIGSQKVRLQADPLNTNRDRYGRLLRYVYLPDNTLIEQKLITEGYGFAYTYFPFEKSAEFSAYEQTAKTAGKGLWSACQVNVESNGSKHTNPAF
ncbi:thermonuclease family protein [Candidatus Saccharibacteria bacterium]|nr:thermonuclease family protein [Candidatus Saccharibacteria bacterium]